MLLRRAMTRRDPKPKRVKRSKTKSAASKRLFEILDGAYSETSLSDADSTSSSNPF
nr:ORF3 [Torque teno felis virus]QYD01956.1 ORF3 [Torque teno felis virus]QYD01998.1 ORF3 [Torque teno felis virus]